MMSQTQIKIQLNPNAIAVKLDTALQRVEHFVRIGLNIPDPDLNKLEVPDRNLHFGIVVFPVWGPEEARTQFSTWVLTNGFRDMAEAIANPLEELQRVVSMMALVDQYGGASHVRVTDWENACDAAERRFHGLGLPDKLKHLSEQFGIDFIPSLVRQLLSINAARNCLVHRNGLVGARDVDATQRLNVYYRRLFFAIGSLDAPTEVALPYTKQDGDEFRIATKDDVKSFSLGERVVFSSREFGDLCWTLNRFGANIAEVMVQYCQAHGVSVSDAPAA